MSPRINLLPKMGGLPNILPVPDASWIVPQAWAHHARFGDQIQPVLVCPGSPLMHLALADDIIKMLLQPDVGGIKLTAFTTGCRIRVPIPTRSSPVLFIFFILPFSFVLFTQCQCRNCDPLLCCLRRLVGASLHPSVLVPPSRSSTTIYRLMVSPAREPSVMLSDYHV